MIEAKGIFWVLLLGAFAMFGGLSKILVIVIEQDDTEKVKVSKLALLLLLYTIVAMPFGIVIGGFLMDTYNNFWLALGGSLIGGAVSSNVISWVTGDGFVVLTRIITRRSK